MFSEALISLVGLLTVHGARAQAPILTLNDLPIAKYVAPAAPTPIKKNMDSLGMAVTARSAAVIDVSSGAVLFEKDADGAYPVASLTKLLTAMVFLDMEPDYRGQITITPQDQTTEGALVFVDNERLTKRDALRALLVGSVNAAANALARSTGDYDAFIRAMNEKARTLGLRQSSFSDPVGLGRDNRASALDMAQALRAALNYTEIRQASELNKITVKGLATNRNYQIQSTNLLLQSFLNKKPFRVVAAKTGSLPEAGYCLAQATRNELGNEVIVVVLGSDNHFSRFQDAKALTAWAFDNFEWPQKSLVK